MAKEKFFALLESVCYCREMKSIEEKTIYCIIAGWERFGQYCTMSHQQFCAILGCSRSSVKRIIDKLKQKGLIEVSRDGYLTSSGMTCRYHLLVQPDQLTKITKNEIDAYIDIFGDDGDV